MEFLESKAQEGCFQLIMIHGRRRVGKTTILREFLRGKDHSVYFVADQIAPKILLERLYHETSIQLDGFALSFKNLDEYFKYIHHKSKDVPIIMVWDEFQYLCEVLPSFPSMLQRWIDRQFKDTRLFLILCGSEIRMMQELFGVKNPLHGRRTGQLKVRPLTFIDLKEFFPLSSSTRLVEIRGAYGGIPAYLIHYDERKNFWENIKNTHFNPTHVLFEEPEHLLRQEFREIQRYWSILHSVAQGNTRIVDIANNTGIEARSLPKYLDTLIATDLLVKEVPLGLKKSRSRHTLYSLADEFLHFWFRFVFPHKAQLELGNVEPVLLKVQESWHQYLGEIFEKVIKELLITANVNNLLPTQYLTMGRWWKKDSEIDIVAVNHNSTAALFVEVKWGHQVNGNKVLNDLETKIATSHWHDIKDKRLAVISRGFSSTLDKGQIPFKKLFETVTNPSDNKNARFLRNAFLKL